MPNLKTHCAISKKRTGFDFEELHKWIDDPKKDLGYDHRQERHSFNEKDMKYIKDYWNKKGKGLGEKAIIEWLFHIALDNLHTAFKLSSKDFSYGEKAFNYMQFGLNKSGYIHCNFEYVPDSKLEYIVDESRLQDDEDESFINALIKKFF